MTDADGHNVKLQDPIQRLIFLGPPGSGKGTHSSWLKKEKNVVHLSTGEMLREAISKRTPVGKQVEQIMARGDLVSDEIVCAIVEEKLKGLIETNLLEGGFLFDGFPRTLNQARKLDEILKLHNLPLTGVFLFECSTKSLQARVCGRWFHAPSNRVYHETLNKPKVPFKDDLTGESLIQRPDDTEEAFHIRMEKYKELSAALIDHYRESKLLINIDADREMENVHSQIAEKFTHTDSLSVG